LVQGRACGESAGREIETEMEWGAAECTRLALATRFYGDMEARKEVTMETDEGFEYYVPGTRGHRDYCRNCLADFPTDEEIERDQCGENPPDMVIDECRRKGCGALYIYRDHEPHVDREDDEPQGVDQGVLPF
jgi:hypothetical protein